MPVDAVDLFSLLETLNTKYYFVALDTENKNEGR